jgi:hypothetical protein
MDDTQNPLHALAGEMYQEKILSAGYDLLDGLHDLTFHHVNGQTLDRHRQHRWHRSTPIRGSCQSPDGRPG